MGKGGVVGKGGGEGKGKVLKRPLGFFLHASFIFYLSKIFYLSFNVTLLYECYWCYYCVDVIFFQWKVLVLLQARIKQERGDDICVCILNLQKV